MHPRLAELVAHADRARAELLAAAEAFSPERLQQPGPGGGWSPAQHLAHLHLVEQSALRAMFRTLRTARAAGLPAETDTSSLLGALDATGLAVGKGKVDAPDFVQPTDAPDLDTLRGRLAESRAGLHLWAAEADGFALAQAHFLHPRLGTLNLYEWVLMIADHERRHLRHLRAMLDAP